MIVWLDGGFGAGKTTLAAELHRRLPGAVVCDPEDVGRMLWSWTSPNDDFQDLASWRELVVASVLALRRHHADTVIVPMSVVRAAYRDELLGGLAEAGEELLHVFLHAELDVLLQRVGDRETPDGHPAANGPALAWARPRVAAAVEAADQQPGATLVLRSDRLTPSELADAVLSAAGLGHGA